MSALRLVAHAKVNLTLDVIGRRDDGYHELRSVFARISLADDVRVSRSRRWVASIRPAVGDGMDLGERAARALAARLGRDGLAAAIRVRKRIPVAAGLGGGSSDAAHVLRALRTLWRAPVDAVDDVARATGADVPFFLAGCALAEVGGRGERVRALRGGPWHGVLVAPRGRIATADAFARLGRTEWSDGSRTAALVRRLEEGSVDAGRLRSLCGNDLERVASSLCDEIAALRERAAPATLYLSGSGPSLFAIADDRRSALALTRRMKRAGARAVPIVIAVSSGAPVS